MLTFSRFVRRLMFPTAWIVALTAATAPAFSAEANSPASAAAVSPRGKVAPKPLFRDPVCDGAADSVVLWNPHVQRWWMFYTNRRANVPGLSGVAWVHGTKIGLAESADGGATWSYLGTCDIELPPEFGGADATHWAPEVITAPDGTHHMWLTVVPGVFENWQHPRTLVHLTSADLRTWRNPQPLALASDRVIDACVYQLEDGTWRLWYNNERDRKSIYYADSADLVHWTDKGKAVGDQGGEGPKVFRWKGGFWMITDVWRGLAVYRSPDGLNWARQPGDNLLQHAGTGADDQVKGGHCDVVVTGARAFLFYFTHPGRTPEFEKTDGPAQRRSSIQVVELFEKDGVLSCDREQPTHIALPALGGIEDRALLRALGKRDARVHDPSTLLRVGDEWWMFATGRGVSAWRSNDLETWRRAPAVFGEFPKWITEVAPDQKGHFWAPDVVRIGDRVLLYYSVSAFGKRTSAIALATSPVPAAPDAGFAWNDEGIVVRTTEADDFNAIDPSLLHDRDGKLWMAFGSFWSGLKLIELDPATGKRTAPDAAPRPLAWKKEIEAATLHRRGDWYYLFVNWGFCCRGVESTYEVRVGRSRSVTGPYLDRDGTDLLAGGGTLFMTSEGAFIGPGHVGIAHDGTREWVGVHFYDRTQGGRSLFSLRPLTWSDDGWPVAGRL